MAETSPPDVIGPVGGKTITFVQRAASTNGELTTLEVVATPFRGEIHYHPMAEERIEVLEGSVTVHVGGTDVKAIPGEQVIIPPGVLHTWSNDSDWPVRVRIGFRPGGAIESYLRTTYGLHRDRRVNSAGKFPLLQTAVLSSDYREMMVFELNPKRRAILRVIAPIGRIIGYRSAYPEYEPSKVPR